MRNPAQPVFEPVGERVVGRGQSAVALDDNDRRRGRRILKRCRQAGCLDAQRAGRQQALGRINGNVGKRRKQANCENRHDNPGHDDRVAEADSKATERVKEAGHAVLRGKGLAVVPESVDADARSVVGAAR